MTHQTAPPAGSRLAGKRAIITGAAGGINATDILMDGGRSHLYHE
jgi:hypothetical protein